MFDRSVLRLIDELARTVRKLNIPRTDGTVSPIERSVSECMLVQLDKCLEGLSLTIHLPSGDGSKRYTRNLLSHEGPVAIEINAVAEALMVLTTDCEHLLVHSIPNTNETDMTDMTNEVVDTAFLRHSRSTGSTKANDQPDAPDVVDQLQRIPSSGTPLDARGMAGAAAPPLPL